MRLRTKDIQDECIHIRGKERGGGKWRTIAFAPETWGEVHHYESLREDMIEEARGRDPDVEVPERWIIYRKGKTLGAYGTTAMDNIVQRAGERAGLRRRLNHHTNRRTCGRLQYKAGVPLEEIAESFGHADTKQTIRYLGLNIEDLAEGQKKTYLFLQRMKNKKKRTDQEPPIRVLK